MTPALDAILGRTDLRSICLVMARTSKRDGPGRPMGGDLLDLVEVDEDRNVWLVQRKPPEGVIAPEPTPEPPSEAP